MDNFRGAADVARIRDGHDHRHHIQIESFHRYQKN
jgi:hypothetical protein